jgi:hypothetical protein
MVAGVIVILCLFIILFILFRPRPSKYFRDVTGTRNGQERGFGDY